VIVKWLLAEGGANIFDVCDKGCNALPADQVMEMSPQHSCVVEEGARLRAGLPAYLARRRALLAEHTSLIAPLLTLVSSYEEPTTTGELWATELGALP
jgi:hypothetical protein